MENKPLVSIVIPLYNGSNYVEQAIKSALNQIYENIEIVIVNDGSTDDGAGKNVVMKYADKVSYYEKPNGGCASALNYGIKMAKGEFVSWLSHDDLYYPEKIEWQINLYEQKNLDKDKVIISNGADLIDANGKNIYHPTSNFSGLLDGKKAFNYLLFNKCFNGCGLLIPKRIFENTYFFDEKLRFVLDWNLWLKFALSDCYFYVDNKILASNRCHGGQVTVKQKELHSKEANVTVEELVEIAKNNENDYFIRQLYYFSYSTGRGDAKSIKQRLKERKIKIKNSVCFRLKVKNKIKKLLKTVYHKIVR